MEVPYQLWPHFLIRNFNTRMYEEFQRLALDDAVHNGTDVLLFSLIKLYTQSLLSPQTMVRYRVVRDYVTLVEFNDDDYCPTFTQLQSDLKSGCLHSSSRQRLQWLLKSDVLALLEI
jgi:la-related protein 1